MEFKCTFCNCTPLMNAVISDRQEIAELLLRLPGIDTTIVNIFFQTIYIIPNELFMKFFAFMFYGISYNLHFIMML